MVAQLQQRGSMRPEDGDPPEALRVADVAHKLRTALGDPPPVGIVLGSGLTPVVARLADAVEASFSAVGLPEPTVSGHTGRVIVGRLGGTWVVLLAGRVHLYEGHAPATVVRGVRALATWGVGRIVLTNAAGSLHPDLPPGTLVRIADHLNLTGSSPLVGPAYGVRFPDAAQAWSPELGSALDAAATRAGVRLARGTYAGVLGPSYETRAEVRALAALGADVVGMSTVHEALAVCALGVPLAGVAVVSNYGAGVQDGPIDHAAVTAVASQAAEHLADVLAHAAPHLAKVEVDRPG